MINVNDKPWEKLRLSDVEKFLSSSTDENFFYEFKSDSEEPFKLIKEISAFANTYGGYIFLGINDDKTIGGCTKWTEQRIHATIHDCITPIPNFDVKKFISNAGKIFVIKIEEGTMPPYVTNKGQIYERVSSGSFPIKESSKLAQLYNKRNDQLLKIKNKIELPEIDMSGNSPNNLCAYLDLGFSVTCSRDTNLQKNFYKFDFHAISDYLKTTGLKYTISRVGTSYVISIGNLSVTDDRGNSIMVNAGIQNYIEIMCDGSVRSRIILSCVPGETQADITGTIHIKGVFSDIYKMIFGVNFNKIFVHAHKYEKLTVLKQFTPMYSFYALEDDDRYRNYLLNHRENYGDNLIVNSNRTPKNDYMLIDKSYFDTYKIRYNNDNLISELFFSYHFNLGYIDLPENTEE